MFLTDLSRPTGTVAAVGTGVLSIVVAVATVLTQLPPGTLQTAFDFRHNPIAAILAIAAILTALGAIVKAGAGRSFVPSVDGVTTVEVPSGTDVHLGLPDTSKLPITTPKSVS